MPTSKNQLAIKDCTTNAICNIPVEQEVTSLGLYKGQKLRSSSNLIPIIQKTQKKPVAAKGFISERPLFYIFNCIRNVGKLKICHFSFKVAFKVGF